jgi:hypothetical protein
MKILLIGNFAPPFEEENLQNITLFNKLVEDGHECSVINISRYPSQDKRFINTESNIGYLITLLRHSRMKDVIHFSTKGYLRVGLLKMMLSIFAARTFRAKSIITFYSEFFSVLGQMRSPFGGTQTLFTSFFLADKIIFADKDTYDVAAMYKKRSNFELVPSFIYMPDSSSERDVSLSDKLKDKKKVIVFTNVMQSSFLFEVLKELLANFPLHEDAGIVISSARESSADLREKIRETVRGIHDGLIIIERDDIGSALTAFSRADIILRPLSCDGETFFEGFTLSARKTSHKGNFICFPGGLVLVKEGAAAKSCANIVSTLLSEETAPSPDLPTQDPYRTIRNIYEK